MALDVTLCCICLKTSEMLLDIFEEQSNHKTFAAIITQHFWFDIKREENISKSVCVECWSKIDNFHTFYTHVYTIHNEFFARVHEAIKIEVDDGPEPERRNESERQISFEELIHHEVGKFETLIVNENHELSNIIDFKEEEPIFKLIDNINSEALVGKPKVKNLKNKKLKNSGVSNEAEELAITNNEDSKKHEIASKENNLKKNKFLRSHAKESFDKEKTVEQTKDNVVENPSFEHIEESCKNEWDAAKPTVSEKTIHSDETIISESSNDSFEADDANFQDNDQSSNSSDSDETTKAPQAKRAKRKKKKSGETDPNAATKLEEENVKIGELFKMECELCTFHFENFTHALLHYREAHNKLGFLRCCDAKFTTRPTVMEHVQFHLSPDEFKCGQCGKIFIRKTSLKEHLLRHLSTENKPFKCPKCPKSYVKYFLLRRHLGIHELEMEQPFDDVDGNNKSSLDSSGVDESQSKPKDESEKTKKKIRKYRFLRKIDPAVEAKIEEENVKIREQFVMHCEICFQPFDTFIDAQSHYRSKHAKPGYLRCCNVKFMTRPTILEHLQRHISPTEFRCGECDKYFVNKRTLTFHMENHQPIIVKPFKCSHCPKSFTDQFFLAKHLETHNEATKEKEISEPGSKFKCNVCDKEYGTRTLLTIHKKDRHERSSLHICDVCAKEFPTKGEFDKHHRNMHEKHARIQCYVCGAWLKTQQYLTRHMLLHQDIDKMIPCTECDKRFPFQKALRNHMSSVHPKEMFSCNMCDKQFKSRNSLKEHLANHTGFSLYKCPHCPKTFSIRATMYSHRKKTHKAEWEEHLRLKAAGLN